MTIHIASDHGGFAAKQALMHWLATAGYAVIDHGPARLDPDDDYPVYGAAVAAALSGPEDLGLLLCRSGAGMAIVANKFPGVRAAVAWDVPSARAARADDHVNVLGLPSDRVSERELRAIVTTFLTTSPKQEERYRRRLREIKTIEENFHRVEGGGDRV